MEHSARNETPTRRTEILDAAASLFAEKGYERTPVKEIAERAGIAPGTIYLYFDCKRDLLLSIADRIIGEAWSETEAELAPLDREAYVAALLQNIFDFVRENQAFLQALIPEIWTDAELQDQFFNQILAPLFETGAGYLEEQIAVGRARPCEVDVVIPAIAGSLMMLPLFHTLAPNQFLEGVSEDQLMEELTRLYLEGLKPAPEGRE
ncbi:MAG: TetR/AcrR family transcriptional regulator [Anaerolineae bacterium]